MKKDLRIINIDGVDGIGKTTQINMLASYLTNQNISCKVLNLEDNVQSALKCAEETWDFLSNSSDNIIICDGSIAKMMVLELIDGVRSSDVAEKYRTILHEHEKLNHQYGMANILMIMDDISACHGRILKRGQLSKVREVGISDFQKERSIILSLRQFNIHTISRNLNFHVIETEDEESILEVHNKLLKYLRNNFKIKKPSN